ncbi:Transposase [Gordonia westfalica]|uniref:Transposase n=1 Tax=Gordonia westfalica TaxID=158898 RepID=A0A1H2IJ18_9ACTN|nr:Transposase [Gordonia westfalica]
MDSGDDVLVAKGYRPVQRDQQFLMPPSMREWLSADDPVWLVIDTVASLDTSAVQAVRKTGGAGRAAYHPDMLLTLLIWGWAQGQRSSRQLERLCHRDVTYRIICAGDVPDHVTIARFRADCAPAIEVLFTQVLMLCARVGMGRLGVVALDGVKIASNASLSANRSERGLQEALAAEAARAAAEHAAADVTEDDDNDHLPPQLHDPGSRRERIAAALAEVQAHDRAVRQPHVKAVEQAQQRADTARSLLETTTAEVERTRAQRRGTPPPEISAAEYATLTRTLDKAIADQQAVIDRYRPGQRGRAPTPVEESYDVVRARRNLERAVMRRNERLRAAAAKAEAHVVRAENRTLDAAQAAVDAAEAAVDAATTRAHTPSDKHPRRNITDPQSRMMPLRGGGWLQGFNCQAVTSDDGLIIATGVGNSPADAPTFSAMLDKAVTAAALIDTHRPHPPETTGIGVVLADAGYLSEHNLTTPRTRSAHRDRQKPGSFRSRETHTDPRGATPTSLADRSHGPPVGHPRGARALLPTRPYR